MTDTDTDPTPAITEALQLLAENRDLQLANAKGRQEVRRLRRLLERDGLVVRHAELTETLEGRTITVTLIDSDEVDAEAAERELAMRVVLALQTVAPVEFGLTLGQRAALDDAIAQLYRSDLPEAEALEAAFGLTS